jgi:uncharacterized membrane protein YczE
LLVLGNPFSIENFLLLILDIVAVAAMLAIALIVIELGSVLISLGIVIYIEPPIGIGNDTLINI